jgi:hypothetical protein
VAALENTEDSQSNNVQDAEEEQVVELRYSYFLPFILPSVVAIIVGFWLAAHLRNLAIEFVLCGVMFVVSVPALVIAGWARIDVVRKVAIGAFMAAFSFVTVTVVRLGYPWLLLLSSIIWFAIFALKARYLEQAESS